jgi:hypothetical protein
MALPAPIFTKLRNAAEHYLQISGSDVDHNWTVNAESTDRIFLRL